MNRDNTGNAHLPGRVEHENGNPSLPARPADKKCSLCGEIKALCDYSYRSTEHRYESKCKACRRALRRKGGDNRTDVKMPAAVVSGNLRRVRTAKRTIEPTVAMTNAIVDAIDFGDVERERPLDHFEKHGAVQRFNEFVALLREGYSEMVGCHVHIRKD